MEIALIENLHREDLNIVEEGLGYKALVDNFNITQDEVAQTVGKSRSSVTNAIRLLSLPYEILELIRLNKLSAGHARALLRLENTDEIIQLAHKIINEALSVRQVENLGKEDPVFNPIDIFEYKNTTNKNDPNEMLTEKNQQEYSSDISFKEDRSNDIIEPKTQKENISEITYKAGPDEDSQNLPENPDSGDNKQDINFCEGLEKKLSKFLKRNVKITNDSWQKKIEIEFLNNNDLIDLANKLCKKI